MVPLCKTRIAPIATKISSRAFNSLNSPMRMRTDDDDWEDRLDPRATYYF
jgi:hypothetical protein